MNVLTLITEPEKLNGLTKEQSSDLFAKLEAVMTVRAAGYGQKGDAVRRAAESLRVSTQAVNHWLQLYSRGGCWALVDGRRSRRSAGGLSETTRTWIYQEYLRLQRNDCGSELYRCICDRARKWWSTGDAKYAIPGMDSPPRITPKGYPEGLSVETIRRCGPDAYEASLARQGRKGSSALLPGILSTRVGTEYLERVFFDDQKYDHYVRAAGYDKPMVPVGFNALDFLTGFFFKPHIRLRWWDDENEAHRTLTQREFVWYVIELLMTVGYRTGDRPTHLVFEHGTASGWRKKSLATAGGEHSFDDALTALTGITIDRSGRFNQPVFADMLFSPQSAGNFRFKAPIESMFHAVRTQGLLLPGPTGRNADEKPEEQYGMLAYEERIAKAAKKLPAHIREAIVSELYSFSEYGTAYGYIYDSINCDREHRLEGWEACGFTVPVWRWPDDGPDQWHPRSELALLSEHRREHALALIRENPELARVRRMSRAEAMQSRRNDPAIKRLTPELAHALIPLEWMTAVKVRSNREIVIRDPLISGAEDMIYSPCLRTAAGRRVNLDPADQVLFCLNPFNPDEVTVCERDGRMIGTTHRIDRAAPTNQELAHELLGARAQLRADLDAPVREAMRPVGAARTAMRETNRALIEEAQPAQSQPAARTRISSPADPFDGYCSADPVISDAEEADPFG